MTDAALLAHYLARAAPEAAAWNLSPECAYIDYRLRTWGRELVGERRGLNVLNVGIGVGEWDDVLGYLLAGRGRLTSIDIDPGSCILLKARQYREGHTNPASVVCADVLTWKPENGFDLVTMVGSTIAETGDCAAALSAGLSLLAKDGWLALVAVGEQRIPATAATILRDETDTTLELPIRLQVLVNA